jgi:hypothetical protein
MSVDQCPAGQPEEDVLERGPAYQRGHRVEPALVHRSTLEDVFLRLTGRTLVD